MARLFPPHFLLSAAGSPEPRERKSNVSYLKNATEKDPDFYAGLAGKVPCRMGGKPCPKALQSGEYLEDAIRRTFSGG